MDTASALTSEIPSHVPSELVVDFDLYNPPGGDTDYHAAWKALQDATDARLLWSRKNGGHWIATRSNDIINILADHANFSHSINIVPAARGNQIKVYPVTLDPPEHGEFRRLLMGALSPRAVKDLEPFIRSTVTELIDGIIDKGECSFVDEFSRHLPVRVFFHHAGLPVADAEYLRPWAELVMRPDGKVTAAEAMKVLEDYVKPYIAERRERPGTDLLSAIASGRVFGRPLTDEEAVSMACNVLLGGLDTVITFLGFVFRFLATSPTHREVLATKPELIPAAIEELLRRFPLVANGRLVKNDYRLGDVEMKAGDMIIAPAVLQSLDYGEHDDALNVDFERANKKHSTFGQGIHICPGAMLARRELKAVLEEWMRRIPDFSLDPRYELKMIGGIVPTIPEIHLRWNTGTKE